ncbi:hypothetical protein DESC_500035 [Desulfosarcina cetonica]|nr:hypothetical protein DESC_500035 [Desulfosarcina cetonica]
MPRTSFPQGTDAKGYPEGRYANGFNSGTGLTLHGQPPIEVHSGCKHARVRLGPAKNPILFFD